MHTFSFWHCGVQVFGSRIADTCVYNNYIDAHMTQCFHTFRWKMPHLRFCKLVFSTWMYHSVSKVTLPKLTIQPFKGELTTWPTFWDSYQVTIHNNILIALQHQKVQLSPLTTSRPRPWCHCWDHLDRCQLYRSGWSVDPVLLEQAAHHWLLH